MKLSEYLADHMEEILIGWDSFAQTLTPAASAMTRKALRDHARQMLLAIALDIDTVQNDSEGIEKSMGHSPDTYALSAASIHGSLREDSGFTLIQLTAEFRALRANVLRLWLATIKEFDETVTKDIVRFNDAVDQALAESAVTFAERTDETRTRFLAILGHDLRTPLSAINMSGQLLILCPTDASRNAEIGHRLRRSAATMTAMVNDLLEYSRTQLGGKMPFEPQLSDMGDIVQAAVNDARLAHLGCEFEVNAQSNLFGYFDTVRMQQAIMNLLTNAAQYRTPDSVVNVNIEGTDEAVSIEISNRGTPIPPESLKTIFDALVQLPTDNEVAGRPSTSMGLGLFVARGIVLTHAGEISVTSTEAHGTVFKIKVPRSLPKQST